MRNVCLWVCACFAMFGFIVVAEQPVTNLDERAEIPAENTLEESKSILQAFLEKEFNDYKAKKITGTQFGDAVLAVMEKAETIQTQYLILTWAQNAYVDDKNYLKAFKTLTEFDKLFKGGDVNGKKVELVQKLLKEAKSDDLVSAVEVFNDVFKECLTTQDKKSCATLFAVWKKNESKYRNIRNIDTYKESVNKYSEIMERQGKLKEKENLLKKSPGDPKLNRAYAEAIVVVEGDWVKAMPYFAKGDNPALRKAALYELCEDDGTLNNLQVGDLYWGVSDKREDEFGVLLKMHAAIFYEDGFDELKGLQKTEVKKRIEDAALAAEELKIKAKKGVVKTGKSAVKKPVFNLKYIDLGIDPFADIRHIRPKPDRKVPKFPWVPNPNLLTDTEYQLAHDQVKYWREYYWDCFKPIDDYKNVKGDVNKVWCVPYETLGVFFHHKGVNFDKKTLSYENMIPIDYSKIDGVLFPKDSIGVELLKDYAIWGKPRWCVKQETLKRYSEPRLKNMKTKELADIIHELVDIMYGGKRGYCASWIERFERHKYVTNDAMAQIYYISYLNIPVITEEARIYAKSIEGIDLIVEHAIDAAECKGGTVVDQTNIRKNSPSLEEARKRLLDGTLPKRIKNESFQGEYVDQFLFHIRGYKRRNDRNAYRWSEADWYGMSYVGAKYNSISTFIGTDEWDARFKEPIRQSLVKRYGGIYNPYADKEKKETWAKMIEEGMTWTDLYGWRILPPCLRGKYNVEKEMGTQLKKIVNYKMEEHRHRWDEVNKTPRKYWEKVKIP